MPQLITALPLFLILFVSKHYTKTYLNPSGVFSGTWAVFLIGHAILAPDYVFSYAAGFVIDSMIAFFLIGEIFLTIIPQHYNKQKIALDNFFIQNYDVIFERRLRLTILSLGALSVVGSLLYFFIFLKHFGSLTDLFTAGWLIREEIGGGKIQVPLLIRVMSLISYSVISLSLIYWIRYRFKLFIILPFASVLIMGIAQAARAGTFIMLILIFIASGWRDKLRGGSKAELKFLKRILIFISIILFIFIIGLMYREQNFSIDVENFRHLAVFKTYAFGAISAFSEFLKKYSFDNNLTWGLYSFSSLFELLGIQKLSFGFYDEYLAISTMNDDYTNIFTIFRSSIEDFSIGGALLYMFLIGFSSSFAYRRAIRGSLAAVAFLNVLYTLLIYSTIAPLTQHNSLLLSFVLPPCLIALLSQKRQRMNVQMIPMSKKIKDLECGIRCGQEE